MEPEGRTSPESRETPERPETLVSRADALMDGLRADLERLAAIPSVAFPGFPPEPVLASTRPAWTTPPRRWQWPPSYGSTRRTSQPPARRETPDDHRTPGGTRAGPEVQLPQRAPKGRDLGRSRPFGNHCAYASGEPPNRSR